MFTHRLNIITMSFLVIIFCSCAPSSNSSANTNRTLDISSGNVDINEVSSYYSLYRYGATQKIYNFIDQNTVILILIPNDSTTFSLSIEVNVFSNNASDTSIRSWVNNQYSDAIFIDAAQPIYTFNLTKENYAITSAIFSTHEIFLGGDEYDNYTVNFSINQTTNPGIYQLKSFIDSTNVHVLTKGLNIAL